MFLVMFLPAIRWAYLSARLSAQAHLPHLLSSILTHSFSSVQEKFQDYYLGMQFMHEFTNETLAIANAWLDPEVMFCCPCLFIFLMLFFCWLLLTPYLPQVFTQRDIDYL